MYKLFVLFEYSIYTNRRGTMSTLFTSKFTEWIPVCRYTSHPETLVRRTEILDTRIYNMISYEI